MIGVVSREYQKPIVLEFFELFKTPWEFYSKENDYDVVLVSDDTTELPPAKLVIVFGAETTQFDVDNHLHPRRRDDIVLLDHYGTCFPVYTGISSFQSPNNSSCLDTIIKTRDGGEPVALLYVNSGVKILRTGYNLFGEIDFLLSRGQPVEYAATPTIEVHISILRKSIVASGILLVEMPPVPYGYSFVACLTHDVDFLELRNHGFDRSLAGFILRALVPVYCRGHQLKAALAKYYRNFVAVLSLPAVYLGFCSDTWFDIDRYLEIEGEIPSTFFFIPSKGDPGQSVPGYPAPKYRAARYAISDYTDLIEELLKRGCEVGIHGLDAWHDPVKGRCELAAVQKITGEDHHGVRMHWLYFSDASPKALSEAGFLYDSSVGYNEAVGFRVGTAQAFRWPGSGSLLELPLIVMDTALFYPDRMGLSERKARDVCATIISKMRRYGGVMTVNWHTRSLSPERNWDDFYINLLAALRIEHAYFFTARQAAYWFMQRRATKLESVEVTSKTVRVTLSQVGGGFEPAPLVRIHLPAKGPKWQPDVSACTSVFVDVPWSGERTMEISI